MKTPFSHKIRAQNSVKSYENTIADEVCFSNCHEFGYKFKNLKTW